MYIFSQYVSTTDHTDDTHNANAIRYHGCQCECTQKSQLDYRAAVSLFHSIFRDGNSIPGIYFT